MQAQFYPNFFTLTKVYSLVAYQYRQQETTRETQKHQQQHQYHHWEAT